MLEKNGKKDIIRDAFTQLLEQTPIPASVPKSTKPK